MAQYDGSIRINTQINTQNASAQLMNLANRIEKTADKIASLRSKMDALKDVKVPTKEYAALDSELSKLGAEYDKIAEGQSKFLQTGGKEGSTAYRRMEYDLNALDVKQDQVIAKMKELEQSGKAFITGAETDEYKKLETDAKNYGNTLDTLVQKQQELNGATKAMSDAEYMRQAEENISRVIARMEEMQRKEAETLSELLQPQYDRPEVESWQQGVSWQEGQREAQALADAVASVGQNAQDSANKSNEAIASMTQELAQLKARQKELEKSGMGLGFEEYDTNVQRISEINDALEGYKRGLSSVQASYRELGDIAIDALKKLSKSIYKYAINPFILLGKTVSKTFLGIGKNAKSSNNVFNKSFKNILKYGLGIRSVYALINKLRTAIKEGFRNLAQFSDPVNESLSSLKSSLTQLKNSLATAFAPILTTIAPLLKTLIDMISQAATYVGMFIATLTGASTFTKAIAVQEDYAASLDKTGSAAKKAAGALAKFDDLDVLAQPSSGSGGAGATETPVTDMFEEVEIPSKFSDIAQWIKDMWAESDFTELGSFLGEKLKETLDNIPWDSIKESARKLGESLATLINGFIEVEGLGYSIGRTLAEAFNTGFEFLNSFVHSLHWDSLGKFIAETLNGIFENIDWELIRDTFVTGFKGLAETINSFIDNFHWDNISDTISNIVNIAAESIYAFFTTTHFDELGEELGEQLMKSIEKIEWEQVGEAIGSVIDASLDFVTSFIGTLEFGEVAQAIFDTLKGAYETIDKGELAEVILSILTVKLAAKITKSLFTNAAGAILSSLSEAITASTSALSGVASSILTGIGSAFSSLGGVSGILTSDLATIAGAGTAAEIGTTIGTGIVAAIIGALAGGIEAKILNNYVLGPLISLFDEELGSYYKNFKWFGEEGFFSTISSDWETSLLASKEMLVDFMNDPVLQGLSDMLIGPWATALIVLPEHLERIKQIFKDTNETIGKQLIFLKDNFKNTNEEIGKQFENLKGNFESTNEAIGSQLEFLKENFVNTIEEIKNQFGSIKENFESTNEAIGSQLEFLKENFVNTNKQIKENLSKTWEDIKKVINSILGGVEKMANGVVNAINTVIRALNALSFEIPDWVPGGLGGKTFSLNLSEISNVTIPKLANGAVIRGGNPFMAILGDQPSGITNIETPLPTMVDAFKQAIAEMGGVGTNERIPVTINLNYDGETFARLSISDILSELGRQGYNVDVLGVT